jgi:hypothetical protein
LPSFPITNQLPLYLLSSPQGFLLSRDIRGDMVIPTSVQSLPICGYSFSKKNFLDIKLPRVCPAHGQGWYLDECR